MSLQGQNKIEIYNERVQDRKCVTGKRIIKSNTNGDNTEKIFISYKNYNK